MAQAKQKNKKQHAKQPLVLLYGVDVTTSRGQAIIDSINNCALCYQMVAPNQLDQQVGALAHMPGHRLHDSDYHDVVPQGECMVLCNVGHKQADTLVRCMRDNDCVIDAKAMLTNTNRGWSFVRLVTQITREHLSV